MTSSDTTSQAFNLRIKQLPVASTKFPTIITATSDNLPGYFETEQLETTPIPEGWDIHFDVICQLRADGYWEDVRQIFAAAMNLSMAGTKFATRWNEMAGECFEDFKLAGQEDEQEVAEMKVKSLEVVARWNESMARSRREVEKAFAVFFELTYAGTLGLGIKGCFAMHQNLGNDGDGERWWTETVVKLTDYGERWMAAPFTLEMWLKDLATSVEGEKEENKLEEVRVYADALCASYEQAEGMRSRSELVYLVKNGGVTKKGMMAWVSVELGHVTGV